jgi:hypothetical protein
MANIAVYTLGAIDENADWSEGTTMLKAFTLAAALAVFCFFSVGPQSSQGAAFDMSVAQTCSGGRANVTFSWRGSGGQQWLDLSLADNGFAPGTFVGAGPVFGSSYTWTGLLGGSRHYVRVNQYLSNGAWDTSETWVFTTQCGPTPDVRPANCHPSYQGGTDTKTGGCIRSGVGDYDCAGGSGNGPNYVRGPVYVVGPDVFDLDRDGDGVGCER